MAEVQELINRRERLRFLEDGSREADEYDAMYMGLASVACRGHLGVLPGARALGQLSLKFNKVYECLRSMQRFVALPPTSRGYRKRAAIAHRFGEGGVRMYELFRRMSVDVFIRGIEPSEYDIFKHGYCAPFGKNLFYTVSSGEVQMFLL
jgi:hypothetical protein